MNPATFDARLQSAHDLGLKYVGSGGWPTGTNMDTVAGALNMAAVLNGLGQRAAQRHMMVYGHNHWPEFATKLSYDVTGDGVPETVPALEVVIRNTDPRYVTFEIDVHWALEGLGYDKQPELLAFLRKYSSRISMLHVKGSDPNGGGPPRPDYAFQRITDVGGPRDITDWKAVFRAASNVDYYHFEYDLAPDPFASAASAFRYLDCIRF
jgi:sugar phosphate isomerase/epimerase